MSMKIPLQFTVKNLKDADAILSNMTPELEYMVINTVSNWAIDTAELARRLAPFKTGKLRDSIYVYQENSDLYILAEAPYAWYQELGTRYVTGKFFMTDAFNAKIPELRPMIEETISKYVFSKITGM